MFPLSEEKELKIYMQYIELLGDNIFLQLSKTADLDKIAEIVKVSSDKKSVTRFVEMLSNRLKEDAFRS
jgi:hypothetical protein